MQTRMYQSLAALPWCVLLCCLVTANRIKADEFKAFHADVPPDVITVATWNLEWFFDDFQANNRSEIARAQSAPDQTEWEWRLEMFAAAIAKFHPTILAVQEIEDRGVMQALAKSLRERHHLNYRVAFIDGYDSGTEQDVAILYQSGLVEYARREQNQAMFESKEFYNLSKHLIARFEWQVGDRTESLSMLVLHLRATADAAELRIKQSRLAHSWMQSRICAGEKVLILGDLNMEQPVGSVTADGDGMYDLLGLRTDDPADDLVDLLERAPELDRRTHLILDKQFDRIVASKSLMDASSGLRFQKIEVLRQFNIRGIGPDEDHWDTRYTKDRDERDLSDHHPVMASFDVLKPQG